MLLYVPNKLINSKKEIIQKHKKSNDVHIDEQSSELLDLITRLVSLREDSLEREAYALSNGEISMISSYIPVNYYDVDMSNLFAIYTYRAEKRYFEILYTTWQDHFKNNECNAFIYQWLNDNDEIFGSVLDISLKPDFRKMLVRGDVLLTFGNIVKEKIIETDNSLEDILEPWNLRYGSKLLWEMKFLLYTYCPKKVYLKISKQELLSYVKQYASKKDGSLKKFVVNFVTEFKLKELERFDDIGRFLLDEVGNPGTSEFSKFLEGVSADLVTKYTDWINKLIIDEVFGKDERSLFWKQYRFRSVVKYERSNSVVMDMGKYVATEFLGKAMGPIYIYKKDVFEDQVKKWFQNRNNAQLRSVLFHHENYFWREVHQGYWQGDVDRILYSNNMTRKIEG
ncbi:hypothetical protein [Butyrivibrio sp. FCS014]|uniref:hypothetical protein n=1 Tax=Butyrivibrio sp. FCS014 TaxID=1408304 RepID=UPI00046592AD|nr:hypothetical protein [Butyrivibrio sp. FCS014]